MPCSYCSRAVLRERKGGLTAPAGGECYSLRAGDWKDLPVETEFKQIFRKFSYSSEGFILNVDLHIQSLPDFLMYLTECTQDGHCS